MAKAASWAVADAEAQKRGEQTGLDTPVVSCLFTHLRAHETSQDLVCRLLLEKKKTCINHKKP